MSSLELPSDFVPGAGFQVELKLQELYCHSPSAIAASIDLSFTIAVTIYSSFPSKVNFTSKWPWFDL